MEIRPFGAALTHEDGQTNTQIDRHTDTDART